jgi:hypothetical protein
LTVPKSLIASYEQWVKTPHDPGEPAVFAGGFVAGSWYMREQILALPEVKSNPALFALIGDVLDIPA